MSKRYIAQKTFVDEVAVDTAYSNSHTQIHEVHSHKHNFLTTYAVAASMRAMTATVIPLSFCSCLLCILGT